MHEAQVNQSEAFSFSGFKRFRPDHAASSHVFVKPLVPTMLLSLTQKDERKLWQVTKFG